MKSQTSCADPLAFLHAVKEVSARALAQPFIMISASRTQLLRSRCALENGLL